MEKQVFYSCFKKFTTIEVISSMGFHLVRLAII
ncbi:MAG: hypothetical protein ACI8RD_005736, partial [Bacillariaceae sp.]